MHQYNSLLFKHTYFTLLPSTNSWLSFSECFSPSRSLQQVINRLLCYQIYNKLTAEPTTLHNHKKQINWSDKLYALLPYFMSGFSLLRITINLTSEYKLQGRNSIYWRTTRYVVSVLQYRNLCCKKRQPYSDHAYICVNSLNKYAVKLWTASRIWKC